MENIDFKNRVENIIESDRRYPYEAYDFINAAIKFTIDALIRSGSASGRRHINAEELLDGIVAFAQDQFGPVAGDVLGRWHLTSASAIGDVVFNMIEAKLLSRSDEDQKSDFAIPYDLDGKLRAPYLQQTRHTGIKLPIIV